MSSRTNSNGSDKFDINSVQALLLFNIGNKVMTAGELKNRGYYQGSNVSYNLKKLVELGYIDHQRCDIDRRSVRVRLTGSREWKFTSMIADLFQRHCGRTGLGRPSERSDGIERHERRSAFGSSGTGPKKSAISIKMAGAAPGGIGPNACAIRYGPRDGEPLRWPRKDARVGRNPGVFRRYSA